MVVEMVHSRNLQPVLDAGSASLIKQWFTHKFLEADM
jgi:hypothetical protein